jgi:putative RecB family exonuclease
MPQRDGAVTRTAPAGRTWWHSVSSTRTYKQCPRRYWYGYVAKVPAERHVPVAWRIGSAVHAALETAYRHRASHPDAPLTDGLSPALDALRAAWDELELPPGDGSAARAASWVTRSLQRDVLATRRVLGVEQALRDELSPGHRIIGFVDLLLDRDERTVEVVDHKVTRWQASRDDLADDLQLNLYGALVRRRWPDQDRVRATLHYPVAPAAVTVTLTEDGMAAARDHLATVARRASADTTFEPVPGQHCGHCPWRPRCPAG